MLKILLLSALAASPSRLGDAGEVGSIGHRHSTTYPYIEVWTNHNEVYRRGDNVRVYFRAETESYVTIFRVDTDGRVRVLFPLAPWEDNYARGDRRYEIRAHGRRHSFGVDDYPGQGYLFAVASRDPFDYHNVVVGDHWDYRQVAAQGRITGDPYVSFMGLIDLIIPPNYADYSYDVLPYYVEQRYDYPRFLCYECHAYASYSHWNPYRYSCVRFRIVLFNDPYYYPARYYSGVRVVYQRPARILPRYIFRSRAPGDRFVTRVRRRPTSSGGRRVADIGVTGGDVGGRGSVPTPITGGRRRPTSSTVQTGESTPRRDPAVQQGGAGRRAARPPQQTRPERREPAVQQGGAGRRAAQPPQQARPERQQLRPETTRRRRAGEPQQPAVRREPERRARQPAEQPRRVVPRAPTSPRRAEPQLERRRPSNRPSAGASDSRQSRRARPSTTRSRPSARSRPSSARRPSSGSSRPRARAPATSRSSSGRRR
ncbi:MAG: DUF4384 domain-containing protein [Gemmatimonadales bacterium]